MQKGQILEPKDRPGNNVVPESLKGKDHEKLGLQEYQYGILALSIIIKSSRPQEVLRTYQGYRLRKTRSNPHTEILALQKI